MENHHFFPGKYHEKWLVSHYYVSLLEDSISFNQATRSPFVATLLVPVMLHCDVAMRGQMLDVPARSDDCAHSMNGAPSSVENPGWLFDIGDYTTQLYGDYNKPL